MSDDVWRLTDPRFRSRLLVGRGRYPDVGTMVKAIAASGAQRVTIARRRFYPKRASDDPYGPLSRRTDGGIVPDTSRARDAVRTAMLGRELRNSPFVTAAVMTAIPSEASNVLALAVLLSPAAAHVIEPMVQRAQALTRQPLGLLPTSPHTDRWFCAARPRG